MFQSQIQAFIDQEDKILQDIDSIEEEMKVCKEKLAVVRKAKKQLQRLEEQFNEPRPTDISPQ